MTPTLHPSSPLSPPQKSPSVSNRRLLPFYQNTLIILPLTLTDLNCCFWRENVEYLHLHCAILVSTLNTEDYM